MKSLLFGGGGFIGSAIADRLLQDGHRVRIFEQTRIEPYRKFHSHEKIEWITGDWLNIRDVTDALDGVDTVFHMVCTTLPGSSNDDPIYDVQTNIVGTLQMLNVMVATRVPKIIFISSGGTVYGTPVYVPVDEKHPTEPGVSYGITKLAIEKYLLIYQKFHGIRAIILRAANPYGERQRIKSAQGVVGVFIYRALRGMPIEIWGDGSVIRDYLYIGDLAEASVKALSYFGKESVFNVGSGSGTSLNELIDLLEDVLGKNIIRRYHPARSIDVAVNVLSNRLIARELGWKPQVLLRDGLLRTVAWINDEFFGEEPGK